MLLLLLLLLLLSTPAPAHVLPVFGEPDIIAPVRRHLAANADDLVWLWEDPTVWGNLAAIANYTSSALSMAPPATDHHLPVRGRFPGGGPGSATVKSLGESSSSPPRRRPPTAKSLILFNIDDDGAGGKETGL